MVGTDTWAIVLAGGDGLRLRGLTADAHGQTVPKQFCSVDGGASLLEMAVARAQRLVPPERILASVTDSHQVWWRDDLSRIPADNIVRQPTNRGTLVGVLLPLLELFARDPSARLIVIPSDHLVLDEIVFERAIRSALDDLDERPDSIVLLGMEPETADPDFGWIVPDRSSAIDPRRVARFAEKPGRTEAGRLRRQGALLNSFVFTAYVWPLIELCERLQTVQYWSLRLAHWNRSGSSDGLFETYAKLPSGDFCRDILSRIPDALAVRKVPLCGWSDIGTPGRLAHWLGRRRPPRHAGRRSDGQRPALTDAVAESVAQQLVG